MCRGKGPQDQDTVGLKSIFIILYNYLQVYWLLVIKNHDSKLVLHIVILLCVSVMLQPDPLPLDVDLSEKVQCVFSPCTQYAVRMRYRYKHKLSHWSEWSLTATRRTDAEGNGL